MPEPNAAKGTEANPLTEADMPFTVPKAGRYWIKLEGRALTQLPEAPKDSVLEVETR